LGLLPFFLVPSAILFPLSPLRYRPWVTVAGGSSFFLYFSYTVLAKQSRVRSASPTSALPENAKTV
jgi:hypothetical protein